MELSLLLVGRDGNGKSSTGNSILGGKHFTPTSSSSSVGVDIQQAKATVDGRVVKVTEIAGLEYPGTDNAGDIEDTLKQIEKTTEENEKGFNAVIIVLKYGVHFTKQEKDALLLIRSIFGSSVVGEFGVVVLTNGDCFDLDVEDDKLTFEEWCRQQSGDVRTLFDDCKSRCVLFNNRTKDEDTIKGQRKELFSAVESISRPYKLDEYKNAVDGLTKIVVQSKLPEVEKHKNDVVNEVWAELGKADQKNSAASLDFLELACLLSNMEEKLMKLKTFLTENDKNTGVLQHLFLDIPVAEMRIHTKRQIVEQKLQMLASSATMAVCFLDGSEYGLQKITDTISIRECAIDKDGNICCKSASGKGVSGYCMTLIEISKTTSSSQQVTETLGLHGQEAQPKVKEQETEDKDQEAQPKVKEQATEDKDQEAQPKVKEQATEDKDQGAQPKVKEQATEDKDQDPQPKVKEQATEDKDQDPRPIVKEQATEDKDQEAQPKAKEQATEDKDQAPQPKVKEQATEDKDQDPQPKIKEQATEVKDRADHSKSNNDLEVTQKMFKKLRKSLKFDNSTHAICLISKYEQKLTKEETDVVIERVKTTYGTSEIEKHSILILTCDNDNLEAEKARMLEDWRKEETGTNQELLNACGKRCVLLNPWTKNEAGSGTGTASKNAKAHPHNAQTATRSASSKPENQGGIRNRLLSYIKGLF